MTIYPSLRTFWMVSKSTPLMRFKHPTMYRCPEYLGLVVAIIAEPSVERVDGSVSKIIDYAK